ncbi:uncharacterized protein [Watersipora subatra]|uniref:uncharacterized protein n=1 Tax=Watersipora subatra TaxID=2589382 RepID=UPI00355C9396
MSSSSSSDSETDASAVKQIPGYYYDRKKKKYFKIQSQAFNPATSLTSSTIQKKKRKNQSKKLMKSVEAEQKRKCHSQNLLQIYSQMQLFGCDNSLSDRVQKLRLQAWDTKRYCYAECRGVPMVTHLTTTGEVYRIDFGGGSLYADSLHGLITGSKQSTRIEDLTCYTKYHMTEYRPGIMVIAFLPDRAAVPQSTLLRTVGKTRTDEYYFSTQHPGLNDTIAVCASPESQSRLFIADRCVSEAIYLIGRDMEKQKNEIALLLDPATCCLTMTSSSATDVYSGSKKGGIFHTDIRSRAGSNHLYYYREFLKSKRRDRRTRIASILSLNDGATLAVSHVTGMKSLFDLRMKRPVAFNTDLVSPCSFDTSVLKKDETGQYLTASGTAGEFVHIWDTKMLTTVKLARLKDKVLGVISPWHCELTSRYGALSLLTMAETSYTLYS